MASAEELDAVRDWVGSTPDDTAIEAALARVTDRDVLLASRSILRRRLADMASAPAMLNVEGDYARTYTEAQLTRLETMIATIEGETADEEPGGLPLVGVGRLSRDCPGR